MSWPRRHAKSASASLSAQPCARPCFTSPAPAYGPRPSVCSSAFCCVSGHYERCAAYSMESASTTHLRSPSSLLLWQQPSSHLQSSPPCASPESTRQPPCGKNELFAPAPDLAENYS